MLSTHPRTFPSTFKAATNSTTTPRELTGVSFSSKEYVRPAVLVGDRLTSSSICTLRFILVIHNLRTTIDDDDPREIGIENALDVRTFDERSEFMKTMSYVSAWCDKSRRTFKGQATICRRGLSTKEISQFVRSKHLVFLSVQKQKIQCFSLTESHLD